MREGILATLGVITPVGFAGLDYLLWSLSDRLVYIGPLDPAAFSWAVVIPMWLAVPVIAGFLWQGLTLRRRYETAIVFASLISLASAVLFWQATSREACQTGWVQTPLGWLLPTIIVGLTVGYGLGVTGLVVARISSSGQRRWAITAGAAIELAMLVAALVVAFTISGAGGCNPA